MRALVTIGTYAFDPLIEAADRAAREMGFGGFAQIGQGAREPAALRWARFLEPSQLRAAMRASDLVIAHAGIGALGDALRSGARVVLAPRRGRTSSAHPANDQLAFARAIAERFAISLAETPDELERAIARAFRAPPPPPPPPSNLAEIARDRLAGDLRPSR